MFKSTVAILAAMILGGWLALSLQSEPEKIVQVERVKEYVIAPPSVHAEPEFGPSLNAPSIAPVAVPVQPAASAPVVKPIRSPMIYAMIARRKCTNYVDPNGKILEIVAQDSTISTEQMTKINALAESCAKLETQTDAAHLGREIDNQ